MKPLIILLLGFSAYGQRYHVDETTSLPYPFDTIRYLKIDRKPLDGIVYNDFGNLGKFVKGKKEGMHKSWHENGSLRMKGVYKNGKTNSSFKSWHPNGELASTSSYKYGKRVGVMKTWYDSGQLKQKSNWRDGKSVGVSKYWYRSGQLRLLTTFEDGEIKSQVCWDEDGKGMVCPWLKTKP